VQEEATQQPANLPLHRLYDMRHCICRITLAIGVVIFCRATLIINGIVFYCTTMALQGLIVCCANMAIHGIVYGCAAMAIGGVVFFGLTAMGIRSIVFRCGNLVAGVVIFCCTMPLWQYAALSSVASQQQCVANITTSQKRGAWQRCQRQRQSNRQQPAGATKGQEGSAM
jgi:hypothetical protein